MPHSVTAIVPNWNGGEETLQCLRSIKMQSYPDSIDVVCVDNCSTDGSPEVIMRQYPWVRVIQLKSPVGAAEAINIGFRKAEGDLILKLDNDVVLDPDCVARLVEVLVSMDAVGAVGPLIYYLDRPALLMGAGGSIDLGTGRASLLHKGADGRVWAEEWFQTQYLQGSATIFTKDILKKVGLLDEQYYVYLDDVDWCIRLARMGYRLLVATRARIWHKGGSTTKRNRVRDYYYSRNSILLTRKNGLGRDKFRRFAAIGLRDLPRAGAKLCLGRTDLATSSSTAVGILDGILTRSRRVVPEW